MNDKTWDAVDNYFTGLFVPPDPALDAALEATTKAGMPAINVTPTQGKLLYILAKMNGARSALEIGTLGGYSTIWLARAVPADGQVISLEIDPAHAAVARASIERAGLSNKVEVRLGAALQSLQQLADRGAGPFDLVFIDADKENNPNYLEWALRLTKPGSLIIIDNVVRSGGVSDPTSTDSSVKGTRSALEALAKNPRLVATALQTVGTKGYDGLAIALVTGS